MQEVSVPMKGTPPWSSMSHHGSPFSSAAAGAALGARPSGASGGKGRFGFFLVCQKARDILLFLTWRCFVLFFILPSASDFHSRGKPSSKLEVEIPGHPYDSKLEALGWPPYVSFSRKTGWPLIRKVTQNDSKPFGVI